MVNEEFLIHTCQYWQNLLESELELNQQRVLYLMQGSVNYVAGAEEGKHCFTVRMMDCWQSEVKIVALLLFLLSLMALQLCPCLGCPEGWQQRFLPGQSRALCDGDRAINSQSTLVSRPPGCNQLTLRVLMCGAGPWGCVCVGSRSRHPLPAAPCPPSAPALPCI